MFFLKNYGAKKLYPNRITHIELTFIRAQQYKAYAYTKSTHYVDDLVYDCMIYDLVKVTGYPLNTFTSAKL